MNAGIRNCPQCGRLFSPTGRNICNRCLDKEEEEYMVVRKYVRDHPGASIFEASEETGIEEDKIMQFIRDGRILSRGFKGALRCEGCGLPLDSGRFCAACIKKTDEEIRGKVPQSTGTPEPERRTPSTGRKSDRMHVRSDQ